MWAVVLSLLCCAQIGPGGAAPAGTPQAQFASGWLNIHDYEYLHVVMPEDAPPLKVRAGEVFDHLWQQATACTVTTSPANEGRFNVWLGRDAIEAGLVPQENVETLGSEGYRLLSYDPPERASRRGATRQVVIAANAEEGALNGVYAFFRKQVNARWLAYDEIIVPRALLSISDFDYTVRPLFDMRELAYRNRWHDARDWQEAHGFHTAFVPGGFGVNTVRELLPPEAFPECYHRGAVCWSAPEMAEAAVKQALVLIKADENADEAIRKRRAAVLAHPSGHVLSMAPAPGEPWCACARCAEAAQLEHTPAAAQLNVANLVADAIAAELPDAGYRVHTLIAGVLPPAPAAMRAHPDVLVQVTTEGCDSSRDLDDSTAPENTAFLRALEGWSRRVFSLHVWDYGCSTVHPLLPFPNIAHIRRNLQVFAQQNVRGVYVHAWDDPAAGPAELAELRAYLYARYLWDPDLPSGDVLGFFLERYYGPAAGQMTQYLATMEEHARDGEGAVAPGRLPVWADDAWLTAAESCFNAARKLPGLPDKFRDRVERAALSPRLIRLLRHPSPEALESLTRDVARLCPGCDPVAFRTSVEAVQAVWPSAK